MMVIGYFVENTMESILFMWDHIITSHGLLITIANEKPMIRGDGGINVHLFLESPYNVN